MKITHDYNECFTKVNYNYVNGNESAMVFIRTESISVCQETGRPRYLVGICDTNKYTGGSWYEHKFFNDKSTAEMQVVNYKNMLLSHGYK